MAVIASGGVFAAGKDPGNGHARCARHSHAVGSSGLVRSVYFRMRPRVNGWIMLLSKGMSKLVHYHPDMWY